MDQALPTSRDERTKAESRLAGSGLRGVLPEPPRGGELRKSRVRLRRRALLALLALAAAAGLVVVWLPDPIQVDVASARRGSLQVTVDEDGRTRVKDRYVVSAPVSGQLA